MDEVWGGRVGQQVQKWFAIIAFLLVWEALPSFGLVDPFLLPPFSAVLRALTKLTLSGEIFGHILSSFRRSFAGFSIAVVVGIPLGVLMGSSPLSIRSLKRGFL